MKLTLYENILLKQSTPINSDIFRHIYIEAQRALTIVKKASRHPNETRTEIEEIMTSCIKLLTKRNHVCIEPKNIQKHPFKKMICTTCNYYYWHYADKIQEAMKKFKHFRLMNHSECHAIHILKKRTENRVYDPECKKISMPNPCSITTI